MNTCRTRICGDRKGVALILVIGMLALMMVIGVTFSIFMRSERTAAGNFRADVQNRELLQVALGRAIDAIEGNVGNAAYPAWDILQSTGSGDLNTNVFTIGSVSNWIPWGVLAATNPAPQWVPVGPQKSQVSWLVLNCSGLIDMNYAGGATRSSGTNASEIQISALPEVANDANATALVAKRRYETLQELGVKAKPILNGLPRELVTYSYCPTNRASAADLFVDISGSDVALETNASIVPALVQSGIDPSQAAFVFTNLLDYVDSDCIPRNLGSACTESVPMINEIQAVCICQFLSSTNVVIRPRLYVEWFYPFLKPNPGSFWITAGISWSVISPAGFPAPAATNGVVQTSYNNNVGPSAYDYHGVIVYPSTTVNYQSFIGQTIRLRANVSVQMRLGSAAGAIVDAAPYPINLSLALALNDSVVVPAPGAVTVTHNVAANIEAVDPRFNWATNGQWFSQAGGSLGAINERTKSSWATFDNVDVFPDMFVADRPLSSVTELTYLLRGTKPKISDDPLDQWNTIRLFDSMSASGQFHPLDTVMDHFYIPGHGYGQGLVNPNTSMQETLASVFYKMPVDGGASLTIDQANDVARLWIDAGLNPWRGRMLKSSDIGHVTNVFSAAAYSGLSLYQKESFFRYVADLFNPRQQYFIVLLYAQNFKGAGGVIAGIAEVWRDPWPDASGQHKCFLRMLRILNNP